VKAGPAPCSPSLLVARTRHALDLQRARIESALAHPDGTSVHDIRVALRRTAALSRVSKGIPANGAGNALAKEAREIRKLLTERRTREVLVARLKERFAEDGRRHALALGAARKLEAGAGTDPGPADSQFERSVARLRRCFETRDRELGALLSSGKWATAADRALRRRASRRIGRLVRRLAEMGVPDRRTLHPFRIAAKRLRYALELLEESVPGATPLLRELRHFQELSGDAHDRIELVHAVRHAASGVLAFRELLGPLELDARRAVRTSTGLASTLLRRLEAVSATLPT
jgi:CHAD domain-containing protein